MGPELARSVTSRPAKSIYKFNYLLSVSDPTGALDSKATWTSSEPTLITNQTSASKTHHEKDLGTVSFSSGACASSTRRTFYRIQDPLL